MSKSNLSNVILSIKKDKKTPIGNKIKSITKKMIEKYNWFYNSLKEYFSYVFQQIKNTIESFSKKIKTGFQKIFTKKKIKL